MYHPAAGNPHARNRTRLHLRAAQTSTIMPRLSSKPGHTVKSGSKGDTAALLPAWLTLTREKPADECSTGKNENHVRVIAASNHIGRTLNSLAGGATGG
jgi:hypothetical protein